MALDGADYAAMQPLWMSEGNRHQGAKPAHSSDSPTYIRT